MGRLAFTREELLADDDFARPQEAAGYRLHGGFDASGRYISPRVKNRWPAIRAWQAQLADKGLPLIDADQKLMKHGSYPNAAQHKMLLSRGMGVSFWNGLTVTGIIEARGQALCHFAAPDFQEVIVEDISDTCTSHLHKGLLYGHGMDEGGDPDHPEIGAHDAMWFAVRDMVFGKDAYPVPEVPESISRPDDGPPMPQIRPDIAGLMMLMMNVLMIEVRAECFFSCCCDILRDPETFRGKRAEAELGAEMVERIRTDEAVHVAYLQTALSEMRGFTFKTVDGGTIKGSDLIDPVWEKMTLWHGETQWKLAREQWRTNFTTREAVESGEAEDLLRAMDKLDATREAA